VLTCAQMPLGCAWERSVDASSVPCLLWALTLPVVGTHSVRVRPVFRVLQSTQHHRETMDKFREFMLLSILSGHLAFSSKHVEVSVIPPSRDVGDDSDAEPVVCDDTVAVVAAEAPGFPSVAVDSDAGAVGVAAPMSCPRDEGIGPMSCHGDDGIGASGAGADPGLSGSTAPLPVTIPSAVIDRFCEAAWENTTKGLETLAFLLGRHVQEGDGLPEPGLVVTEVAIPAQEVTSTSCEPRTGSHIVADPSSSRLKLGWIHVRLAAFKWLPSVSVFLTTTHHT
jgi:hypothetical protein